MDSLCQDEGTGIIGLLSPPPKAQRSWYLLHLRKRCAQNCESKIIIIGQGTNWFYFYKGRKTRKQTLQNSYYKDGVLATGRHSFSVGYKSWFKYLGGAFWKQEIFFFPRWSWGDTRLRSAAKDLCQGPLRVVIPSADFMQYRVGKTCFIEITLPNKINFHAFSWHIPLMSWCPLTQGTRFTTRSSERSKLLYWNSLGGLRKVGGLPGLPCQDESAQPRTCHRTHLGN